MLLGDVGGFQGLLLSAGAVIVGLFTHNNPENYLAKSLYMPYNSKDNVQTGKKIKENELNPVKQYAFKEYLQEVLPGFCTGSGCLRQSRHDKVFAAAREKLQEELDLVHLIHRLRFFESALELILPPEKAK